jgi:hypothetical protein
VPSNPIEKVAPYLYEVGDPILLIAARVEAKVDALKQAEAEVVRCRRALKESRRLLLACVKHTSSSCTNVAMALPISSSMSLDNAFNRSGRCN